MSHMIIELTKNNISEQHIGCAISSSAESKKSAASKKEWMLEAFRDGYRFFRLNENGKVLIETIPAENAWCPLDADNWLFIDCFWVSGKFKGQGYANLLLQTAIDTAKQDGRLGLVAVSSDKKRPFLSDPGYYRHKGFTEVDSAPPYYQLLALPFKSNLPLPRFKPVVRQKLVSSPGIYCVYSNHCPHTQLYHGKLQQKAAELGIPFTSLKLTSKEQAQNQPNPFTSWAMYYNGEFITNEIFSEKKLEAFILANPLK